jgi:predicted RNA-binding protein YlqC (UPF0109 family)
MKELLQIIVRHLVNDPDAVEIKEMRTDSTLVLELTVARGDIGRVIGKQGQTVDAIRNVLKAAASRANQKVVLEIVEPV